jgi:acyl-CoA thioesterase
MAAALALGIEVLRDEPGHGTCRLTVAGEHLNQGLVTHGGVLFTLADTALGVAANPPGEPTWVGTGFSLRLFRAVVVGDTVVADARELHRSRRLVSYAVRLERDGALIGTMDAQLLAAREGGGGRPLGSVTLAPEPAAGPLARALLASAARGRAGAGRRAAGRRRGRPPVRFRGRSRLRLDPPGGARPRAGGRARPRRAGLTVAPSRRPGRALCGCRSPDRSPRRPLARCRRSRGRAR